MKMRAAAALLFTVCLPLAAQDLRVPDALRPAWERLIARHPLPAGIRSGSIGLSEVEAPGFRMVESTALAPVVRLWEPQPELSAEQARSGRFQLLAVPQVALPDVMVPVEGLFPGDDAYPLETRIFLGITGDDDTLRRWFESLPSPERPRRIQWIAAVGDVMPARGVDAALEATGGTERVFGDTLPVLHGADLLLGNLEAAATTRGRPARKTYTFRFDPAALRLLASAGFSYLSVANNHTFDFGRDGFADTLAALAAAGVLTSGAGANRAEAERPAELRIGDTAVRILSFAAYPVDRTGFDGRVTARARDAVPGSLWLDADGLAAAQAAFGPGTFDIALVHGGTEWSTAPSAGQRRAWEALLNAGADLVLGSHPHVLQGMEARDGKLVAYSLGNFLFPGMEGTPGGQSSVILRIGILDGRIVAVRPVPVRLDGRTVRLDRRDTTLAALRERSRALSAAGPGD